MDGVKVKQTEPDMSITLATSILVCLCFCPILGIVSVVFSLMAMRGQRSGETASSRKMKRYANWMNLAGFLVGVLFLGAVLVVAFAHKGADIYFPPPGERNKIYWESQA